MPTSFSLLIYSIGKVLMIKKLAKNRFHTTGDKTLLIISLAVSFPKGIIKKILPSNRQLSKLLIG